MTERKPYESLALERLDRLVGETLSNGGPVVLAAYSTDPATQAEMLAWLNRRPHEEVNLSVRPSGGVEAQLVQGYDFGYQEGPRVLGATINEALARLVVAVAELTEASSMTTKAADPSDEISIAIRYIDLLLQDSTPDNPKPPHPVVRVHGFLRCGDLRFETMRQIDVEAERRRSCSDDSDALPVAKRLAARQITVELLDSLSLHQ